MNILKAGEIASGLFILSFIDSIEGYTPELFDPING